jgi:hypothetical protein
MTEKPTMKRALVAIPLLLCALPATAQEERWSEKLLRTTAMDAIADAGYGCPTVKSLEKAFDKYGRDTLTVVCEIPSHDPMTYTIIMAPNRRLTVIPREKP